ncbi:MAG: DUF2357 domain-containing protein, partial [Lachnospiraceae bacterium]|nr:DUF2357 domain-containing protein [Lachnospiraceae bacterium]
MADNTINELYLKYVNKIGSTLERDRYFQYLFEMIQSSSNVLQQNHQVMHKVIDEAWLTAIEDVLDDINVIIEHPRRYIKTTEEVVPVALAKKITADSVRHLSMNTQFIASSENGDIQPTHILNVTVDETFDLYENRFVYHLIQRLVTFIDKRTDLIFWSTGDETQDTLSYETKIDDAYEEISYKIEMTIKNRQSFVENDSDNMNLFMRIDRVRRLVMNMKNSSFCELMAGCSKVRSPIQRTNMIMKDPHYRACYSLWQFLENYDDIGYSIEVRNSNLQFDEEYLFQIYSNLITNYAVFKSLLETDKRDVEEVLAEKRRKIKPKFIKKIQEEIVDDYNIEDVEIRKVIIEEVTQAQLDAEAALEVEKEERAKAEKALEDMDAQMIELQQQVTELMMQKQQAELRIQEEQQAKDNALVAASEAEAAKTAAQEAQAAAEAQIEVTKQEAEAQIAQTKQEAEAQIAQTKQEAETQITETKQA